MSLFNIIVAVDSVGGIGYKNNMPWSFPLDTRYYETKVTNHSIFPVVVKNALIMGRKTFELFDKNGIKNVSFYVITSQYNSLNEQNKEKDKVLYVQSFESGLDIIHKREHFLSDIWVLGGKSVYESAFSNPYCDKIFITFIDGIFPCDLFLDINQLSVVWTNIVSQYDINQHDHKQYKLTFKEGKRVMDNGR